MMRPWLLGSLLGLLPVLASAGTIAINLGGTPVSITTTAAQEASIQRLVDRQNAERAAMTPPLPPLTREAWVRSVLVSAIQSYQEQAQMREAEDACAQWPTLTGAQQSQIKTALGGSPCR